MMVTRGTAELRVVLYDPGKEGGALLAPVLLPLEYSVALGALLFLCAGAEMHYSGGPSEQTSLFLCKFEAAVEELGKKSGGYIL